MAVEDSTRREHGGRRQAEWRGIIVAGNVTWASGGGESGGVEGESRFENDSGCDYITSSLFPFIAFEAAERAELCPDPRDRRIR